MNGEEQPWLVFAYGSLIWRPDFAYTDSYRACVHGFERRFWQASHDHRGTPSMPGRVLTLVPVEGGRCEGLLYRLPLDTRDEILAMLDEREQDGYERTWLQARLADKDTSVKALTWLAAEGNPSWAGDQPLCELAELIACRSGPSGSNKEYLLRLQAEFERLGIADAHVAALARQVEQLGE